MKVLMPAFANGQLEYLHFKYTALGPDMGSALTFILRHPFDALRLLFENHLPGVSTYRDGLKASTWWLFMAAGGWLCVLRPAFLLMLIPIFGQKMFSDDPNKWSPFFQYSIEFLPVIIMAAIEAVRVLSKTYLRWTLMLALALGSVFSGIHSLSMYRPQAFMPQGIKVLKSGHWTREVPVERIKFALKKNIPDTASVAASSVLVPRLAMRRSISNYPSTIPVQYIVLLKDAIEPYPLKRQALADSISQLIQSPNWQCLHQQDSLYIFKRVQ
jgi:uncharacterized membrane protein